jgi:hypothetical protein
MMTPLEWFAFVILPATLAVVALGVSRLFDVLHPIPTATSTPVPESTPAPPNASRPSEQGDFLRSRVELFFQEQQRAAVEETLKAIQDDLRTLEASGDGGVTFDESLPRSKRSSPSR